MELKDFDLEIESIEHCFSSEYVEDVNYHSNLKVNVPKLMPLIPLDNPYTNKVYINKGVLMNNNETKPIVDDVFYTANYLNLPKSVLMNSHTTIHNGTKLNVIFENKNLNDAKIIMI